MKPVYNLFSEYDQCNHLHAPTAFTWTRDGSGTINFFVDDYVKIHKTVDNGKPHVALLIEPATIQPEIYSWIKKHLDEFDAIFTHDEDMDILRLTTTVPILPIYFMNWYEKNDVPKTKMISMVCSDKAMCIEHRIRQLIADELGGKVHHYGTYKNKTWASYYDCRAEYMFEIVIDNSWGGYWCSEKLANPLANKTIPIYLGAKCFPGDIDLNGIILIQNIRQIFEMVDKILEDPDKEYASRIRAVNHNYEIIDRYKIFEDWLYSEYKDFFRGLRRHE